MTFIRQAPFLKEPTLKRLRVQIFYFKLYAHEGVSHSCAALRRLLSSCSYQRVVPKRLGSRGRNP